ncbi:LOW QUALITY PROTEIN: Helitron helicase [Phytophthora megakarya]|uniref:Helitron helicase n=1 Tax=Phytophthora megakarya TaxID=4795 RepID=A0A225X2U5_9STRA|nr:LOW QUALITY PROTEIN: Helitron helicase [Phytophthora megakarya]
MDADGPKVGFKTLKSLDNTLHVNVKALETYGLPVLEDYRAEAVANEQDTGDLVNQELNAYPLERLETTSAMVARLNPNQQDISDQVIIRTGKSFLIEQTLGKVRLEGGVALTLQAEYQPCYWLEDEQRTRCFGFHSSQMNTLRLVYSNRL